ncbi:MAG: CPBP family glutamic-type intramembrane protease [Candidatus Binataceae bacterium]
MKPTEEDREIGRSRAIANTPPAKPFDGWAFVGGLLAAYVLPVIPGEGTFALAVRAKSVFAGYAIGIAYIALPVAILAGIIIWWEKLPLASAGWRLPTRFEILPAVLGFLACVSSAVSFAYVYFWIAGHLFSDPSMMKLIKRAWASPLWIRIVLVVGDALVEECGRGYVIERVARVSDSATVGGLAALAGSMLGHIAAWGVNKAYVFLPAQLTFVLLYLWRRNVGTCVIAHSLVDAIPIVVFPLFVKPTALALS